MSRKTSTSPTLDQLTVRGFDQRLVQHLREIARARDLSLNRAALFLMRRGAGLATPRQPQPAQAAKVGTSLDRFVGLWSIEEENELLETVQAFDEVDPDLWT